MARGREKVAVWRAAQCNVGVVAAVKAYGAGYIWWCVGCSVALLTSPGSIVAPSRPQPNRNGNGMPAGRVQPPHKRRQGKVA